VGLSVLENMLIAQSIGSGQHWQMWGPLKTPKRIVAALQVLDQFGFKDGAEQQVSTLPEGGRKLLDVALSFALQPQLLLLDEPTSGVSVEEKFTVMDALIRVLKDSGISTVFVEHDMDVVARYADRIIVFAEGSIMAEGRPERVLAQPEVRRHLLGEGT
jgi:branched-chain amino acid transport system ATP-binding protein